MVVTITDRSNPPAATASDVIAARAAGTLWGLFCERVRRTPRATAYRDYDPVAQSWRDHSWEMIAASVDRFRAALAREDLKAGDRVAILLPNGIHWVCLDLAAHASALVVVGLYPLETAASNAYILGHSDARLLLVDNSARWRSLRSYRSEFPSLERVWVGDVDAVPVARAGDPIVRALADVLADGHEAPSPRPAKSGDIATLIYTSGVTARPKGVMMSHFALLWNAEASCAIIPPLRDDVFLSVLPLAHAFERTVGYYLPMMGGCAVAFARSAKDLRADLLAVHPTALLGVPFLYERMCAAIQTKVAGDIARRNLLRLAASIGWRGFEAAQGRARASLGGRILRAVLDKLVARPVLAAFGGRLRVAVSGGAPLDQGVARLLIGLGAPLVEGYGLTEAGPVVAANGVEDNLPGTVGRPLRGVEVRLSPEGELQVRSPSMMAGYWKDDAGTSRALDAKGWLSTGDLAEIRDGRIFIRGRLGDMIVLSVGEKVNPIVVEAKLHCDPLFHQVLVVGDDRPFLVAIVVLNPDAWGRIAAENGLDPMQPNSEGAQVAALARVTPLLDDLPLHSRIRAVHLTLEPWSIEAGLLTPTLKPKRNALRTMFAREIDALYSRPPRRLAAN